jgi:hypothetical protein
MAAFAKAPPSDASELGPFLIDRNDLDSRAIDLQIELASTCFALAALDHN